MIGSSKDIVRYHGAYHAVHVGIESFGSVALCHKRAPLLRVYNPVFPPPHAFVGYNQFKVGPLRLDARGEFKSRINHLMKPIRDVAPERGVSVSEADIWDQTSVNVFRGEKNHAKLSSIKTKADPHGSVSGSKLEYRFTQIHMLSQAT